VPKTLSDTDIADFRDRLCDVAEKLFAEHGLEAVTMRQMAAELGVSPMTPYRYFQDKDAILAAVRTRAFDAFAEEMEKADAERCAPGEENMEAYVDFALAHPHAYKLMFDVSQPTFADYPDLMRAMQRARATMAMPVADLGREGRSASEVETIAHGYWAALHGSVMLALGHMLSPGVDLKAMVRSVIGAMRKGYAAKA
jgi:AcrR family transcriptional regulator